MRWSSTASQIGSTPSLNATRSSSDTCSRNAFQMNRKSIRTARSRDSSGMPWRARRRPTSRDRERRSEVTGSPATSRRRYSRDSRAVASSSSSAIAASGYPVTPRTSRR
ncbi:hypothetical protein GCM10009602_27020 [Nocardiopsis tropica]